jgi:hypothetical protein
MGAATAETMTRAVVSSLRERLERLHLHQRDPEALAADIRAVAKRASADFKRPYVDHSKHDKPFSILAEGVMLRGSTWAIVSPTR